MDMFSQTKPVFNGKKFACNLSKWGGIGLAGGVLVGALMHFNEQNNINAAGKTDLNSWCQMYEGQEALYKYRSFIAQRAEPDLALAIMKMDLVLRRVATTQMDNFIRVVYSIISSHYVLCGKYQAEKLTEAQQLERTRDKELRKLKKKDRKENATQEEGIPPSQPGIKENPLLCRKVSIKDVAICMGMVERASQYMNDAILVYECQPQSRAILAILSSYRNNIPRMLNNYASDFEGLAFETEKDSSLAIQETIHAVNRNERDLSLAIQNTLHAIDSQGLRF